MSIIIIILILFFASPCFSARQDLDEAMARKTRYSTNTFYSGEAGPYYIWQPETLSWTDTRTQKEIWRIAWYPDQWQLHSKEYSTTAFSYNGSKLGFFDYPNRLRSSGDPNHNDNNYRWIVNSDGTKLRAGTGYGIQVQSAGYQWSLYESAYYTTGGIDGGDTDQIWKVTVDSNNTMTNSLILDINDGHAKQFAVKDIMSTNGRWLVVMDLSTYDYPTPNDINSSAVYFIDLNASPVAVTNYWGLARKMGPSYGHTVVGTDTLSYRCILGHTASADDRPITGANWATYWEIIPEPLAPKGTKAYFDTWVLGTTYSSTAYSDPYFGHDPTKETAPHGGDAFIVGQDADGIIILYSGETNSSFWYLKKSGSYADGGPQWEDWDGNSFGTNEEIKMISNNPDSSVKPSNPYNNGYFGHICIDRWGKYLISEFGNDTGDGIRWGDNSTPGMIVLDISQDYKNPTYGSGAWPNADSSNYPTHYNEYIAGHKSWTGWTDYVVHGLWSGTDTIIYGNYYYSTAQATKDNYRAADSLFSIEGVSASYDGTLNDNSVPKPSQSPDGTKVAFHTLLFNTYDDTNEDDENGVALAYAVAYYPYPPEITQATASTGTVTIRFDYRLDQETPRGYTTRGWPDESTDDPPPPREVEKFRLWKSTNNSTWVPVTTANSNLWTMYNYATGVWNGNTYWEISTTQAISSTMYYAVTAIEYSGLESRSLSNTWKVVLDGDGNISTQAVETAYPASPGAKGNFYPSYSAGYPALVRYYNVYAKDGAAPTPSQQTRIASIPKAHCSGALCSWVDWLGATDGTTQYVIKAVDTQGNESASLSLTSTHQKSPATATGQYTLEWTNLIAGSSSIGVTLRGAVIK